MWKISLTITAKYRFIDNKSPYKAKYVSCSCPILENLKLPVYKQNKNFSLFRFCKMEQECLNNIDFKLEIDTREDNYLQ